jgi:aryl-alcohol dehydrogenase-like predicted oxidoreductase
MAGDLMERRNLGGLDVSVTGLGCNNFGRRVDLDGTRAVVDAAIDAGVTFFDTADIYGSEGGASETLLGQVLEGRHDQVELATKFGMDMSGRGADDVPDAPRGSREYIRWAIDGSLRRLRTDVIDLYQYHEPDGITPISQTLAYMSELVEEGKVRFLGVSNFDAAQLREAHDAVGDRLVSLQNEYSLLKRGIEEEVTPECERLGIGILPFFPLASGLLTGKYRRGQDAPEGTRLHGSDSVADDETFDRLEQLASYAEARGIEPIDVAIAGLAAQPAVASVIAGATKPEQVQRNARAAEWKPSQDDLRELDEIFPSRLAQAREQPA